MMLTFDDIKTLDYSARGEPFCAGSGNASVDAMTLDFAMRGEPFAGLDAPSGPADTRLAVDFTVDVSVSAPLTTAVLFSASFTVDVSMSVFFNLGSSAKLVQVF